MKSDEKSFRIKSSMAPPPNYLRTSTHCMAGIRALAALEICSAGTGHHFLNEELPSEARSAQIVGKPEVETPPAATCGSRTTPNGREPSGFLAANLSCARAASNFARRVKQNEPN